MAKDTYQNKLLKFLGCIWVCIKVGVGLLIVTMIVVACVYSPVDRFIGRTEVMAVHQCVGDNTVSCRADLDGRRANVRGLVAPGDIAFKYCSYLRFEDRFNMLDCKYSARDRGETY
jgi:hypothetical protein